MAEPFSSFVLLVHIQLIPFQQLDILRAQRWIQIHFQHVCLGFCHHHDSLANACKLLGGRKRLHDWSSETFFNLVTKRTHALHEELV